MGWVVLATPGEDFASFWPLSLRASLPLESLKAGAAPSVAGASLRPTSKFMPVVCKIVPAFLDFEGDGVADSGAWDARELLAAEAEDLGLPKPPSVRNDVLGDRVSSKRDGKGLSKGSPLRSLST